MADRPESGTITFAGVPATESPYDGYGRYQTKGFRDVMVAADKCVAMGGWFTGFSEFRDNGTEYITMTLNYPPHPHKVLARK